MNFCLVAASKFDDGIDQGPQTMAHRPDTAPQGPQSGPRYLQTPPPGVGGGNQAAADDCLPLHPRAGPLVKKFEDP